MGPTKSGPPRTCVHPTCSSDTEIEPALKSLARMAGGAVLRATRRFTRSSGSVSGVFRG
nr:hypothetical protein [Kibdelosporangium sp. MJ126-NF4]CTQ93108.1 hypothetical protein [Kibdelosporangium sp. MJ126-NF4]